MTDQIPQEPPINPADIEEMPVGMHAVERFVVERMGGALSFDVRAETMRRIEAETGNPLITYIAKTDAIPIPQWTGAIPIQHADIEAFDQLIDSTLPHCKSGTIDVLLVSDGGSAEAAERIVRLLRDNFEGVRFILPSHAYSAATMMSFACDEVLMTDAATLGPIDPQIGSVPARVILRGMEYIEQRIKEEGTAALAAHIHLISGYSLHLIELCKDAEALSRELARDWLSQYMLKCSPDDPRVMDIVSYFASYDTHKSHGRSIGIKQARSQGLRITELKRGTKLSNLVRSLHDQSRLLLNSSNFLKLFENAHGTAWGRQGTIPNIPVPNMPMNLPIQ